MAVIERRTLTPETLDDRKLTAEAVAAGLVGTVAMTLLFAVAPAAGLARINLAGSLGRAMQGHWGYTAAEQIAGAIAYLGLGLGLAVGYAWLVQRRRPRASGPACALFAAGVWLLAQLVVLPLAGLGVFGSRLDYPVAQAFVTLLGALVYGAVTGLILRAEVAHTALPLIEVR